MNPDYVIYWKREGKRCRMAGCGEFMHPDILMQHEILEAEMGPQGGWKCKAGHSGWIWPSECILEETIELDDMLAAIKD